MTVGDDSLGFHIKNIRRALGDDRQTAAYVRSVSGRGYCFTARVERSDMPEPSGASVAMLDARSNLPTRSSAIVGRTASDPSIDISVTPTGNHEHRNKPEWG